MAKDIIEMTFQTEVAHQDRIMGRLVSGQKFQGKVLACATDYFQIVELQIEDSEGNLKQEPGDIIRMRYDAIMFFDKQR